MINNSAVLARYWINDLLNAGLSYSRISRRLNFSPSTIQKIAKKLRTPRAKTLLALGRYYSTIFTTPNLYGEYVQSYYLKHRTTITTTLELTKQLLLNKAP